MIFTELCLENFGPYYGKHLINLRCDSVENSRSIILFGGMNGQGKTTLLDAIRLVLYGQRAQCSKRGNMSYADFLNQCVNENASPVDSTRIELEFEHFSDGSWRKLRVVRLWKRNPKDGKDHLGVLEGDWVDDTLVEMWDEYIETFLPLGISNLFLFDGEQVEKLAEEEELPQNIVNSIKSLLGLQLAEQLSQDLEVIVNRKRKSIASALQLEEIQKMEDQINLLSQERESVLDQLSQAQENLELAKQRFDRADERLRLEGGRFTAEKATLLEQEKKLEYQRVEQESQLLRSAETSLPLMLISPLLSQAKQQGEKEIKAKSAQMAKEVIEKRDQKLLTYIKTLVKQDKITDKIQDFLAQENLELSDDISAVHDMFLDISPSHIKQIELLLEHQLPSEVKEVNEVISSIKKTKHEIESIERKLVMTSASEIYSKLEKERNHCQEDLINQKTLYSELQKQGENLAKAIEGLKKKLHKYNEENIDQNSEQYLLQTIAQVQSTLQEYKHRLTLKKLNKLENEVTECFRYLLYKSNLVHRILIEENNFNLKLYDPHGKLVPKNRLSAGEKQLLSIAFLWSLARVSGRELPLVIDTPLARLDSSHRNHLIKRYFPSASHQVILLSTNTEFAKEEYKLLKEQEAIAQEYLLVYDEEKRQTSIKQGYFWS